MNATYATILATLAEAPNGNQLSSHNPANMDALVARGLITSRPLFPGVAVGRRYSITPAGRDALAAAFLAA